MAQDPGTSSGPDLTEGVRLAELTDNGKLVGYVGGDRPRYLAQLLR